MYWMYLTMLINNFNRCIDYIRDILGGYLLMRQEPFTFLRIEIILSVTIIAVRTHPMIIAASGEAVSAPSPVKEGR